MNKKAQSLGGILMAFIVISVMVVLGVIMMSDLQEALGNVTIVTEVSNTTVTNIELPFVGMEKLFITVVVISLVLAILIVAFNSFRSFGDSYESSDDDDDEEEDSLVEEDCKIEEDDGLDFLKEDYETKQLKKINFILSQGEKKEPKNEVKSKEVKKEPIKKKQGPKEDLTKEDIKESNFRDSTFEDSKFD